MRFVVNTSLVSSANRPHRLRFHMSLKVMNDKAPAWISSSEVVLVHGESANTVSEPNPPWRSNPALQNEEIDVKRPRQIAIGSDSSWANRIVNTTAPIASQAKMKRSTRFERLVASRSDKVGDPSWS